MHIKSPLEELVQQLVGDVEFYRRRHRNAVVDRALDPEIAKEIIAAIIELQLQMAMHWTLKPKDPYAHLDVAVRKAFPDYDPDRLEFRGEAQVITGSQHLFLKVIDPLYCQIQNLIHGVMGESHTWNLWEVIFYHPKVRMAVAVDAFGGKTAEDYKGRTGVDFVERLGPWTMELRNHGDYRALDWMRRYEAGEIEHTGQDPLLDTQFGEASDEIKTLPMLLEEVDLTSGIRTFGVTPPTPAI